jgi:antitoxin VapB
MDPEAPTDAEKTFRVARLFRNGRNQAVRIPRELELPGDTVTIRRDGNRLIIEPARTRPNLREVLRRLAAEGGVSEPFPGVDEGLLPVDDVDL